MEYTLMIRIFIIYFSVQILKCELCSQVHTLDCENGYQEKENEDVCGTDGVWYHNYCHYAKAKCKDRNLTILNVGPCEYNETMQTILPANNITDVFTENTTLTSYVSVEISNSTNVTMTTTTTATTTTTEVLDPIKEIFCRGVLDGTIHCTDDLNPYCGSDYKFYLNNCEFEAAKCVNTLLTKIPLEKCKERT